MPERSEIHLRKETVQICKTKCCCPEILASFWSIWFALWCTTSFIQRICHTAITTKFAKYQCCWFSFRKHSMWNFNRSPKRLSVIQLPITIEIVKVKIGSRIRTNASLCSHYDWTGRTMWMRHQGCTEQHNKPPRCQAGLGVVKLLLEALY